MKYLKIKQHIYILVGLMLLLLINLNFVNAEDNLEDYLLHCHAPKELHDPVEMASILTSPEVVLQFITEMNETAATKALIQCLMTPESRQVIISRVTNPYNLINAMGTLITAQTFHNWMTLLLYPTPPQ